MFLTYVTAQVLKGSLKKFPHQAKNISLALDFPNQNLRQIGPGVSEL